MKKWMILLLFASIFACNKDKPLTPRNFPELKGYWIVQNDYPFWNLKNTKTTSCVSMALTYLIDSVSPTEYIIFEGDPSGQSYYKGNRIDMQIDTLTDSLYVAYGHNTQYSNPFISFFKLNLKYNRTSKKIEGEIGINSRVHCTNLPSDSFQGKTVWYKY